MLHSISELVSKYLSPYHRSGKDEIRAYICPFCGGGDSQDQYTFSLNTETGNYYCFRGSCGAKGNAAQLAAHFNETIQVNGYKMTMNNQQQYILPDIQLYPLTDTIKEYFYNRGITDETLEAFKVSASKDGNIIFPFYVKNSLIYVKYRKPGKREKNEPKEWQISKTRPVLFGMDLCTTDFPLVIVEGEIDAMSLYEAGARNVVSVPCGCDNLKWIEECWEFLEKFNEITIFGDNDVPGKQMVNNIVKRLGEARCSVVENYPLKANGAECKDANEILCECGEFELIEALDSAKEIPIRGIIDLADVIPEDPTSITRIKTNVPDLDKAIDGLRMGAITVFTGKAGHGKSTLAGTLLLNAIEQGYNCMAYSGELNQGEFQNWINLQAAGSDYITLKYDPIKDEKVPYVPQDVSDAIRRWYKGKLLIYNNDEVFEENQAKSIIKIFESAAMRYGCKLFLVDNLMTTTGDSDEETRAQIRFVNMIKRFAKKYMVHVILVAHPRKLATGKTKIGQDDVAGSSAIVNLAHSAIVVEKPNLRVIKSRATGKLVTIRCVYCPDSHRIYQANVGDKNVFNWNDGSVQMPRVKACDNPDFQVQVGEEDGMF